MSSLIIFGLLIALMLTGMPISIALGMTVLTFIYTMTHVPTELVALKLFTGIDNFEIMAIPFFQQFPDPWRRCAPHDQFCNFNGRALVWRTGTGRRDGIGAVGGSVGIVAGDRDRDRIDHDAGDGEAGISQALRRA